MSPWAKAAPVLLFSLTAYLIVVAVLKWRARHVAL